MDWLSNVWTWLNDRWDWLANIHADAWSAAAGWTTATIALGTVTVAGIYASKQVAAALKQADEARDTREAQAQPNVVIYIEPNQTHWHALELVVKNFGSTPARNVQLAITPEPKVSPRPGGESATDLWYPKVIPFLAPWQEWRSYWDFAPSRFEHSDLAIRHDAEATFEDVHGKTHTTQAVLDWHMLKDAKRIGVKSVHDLVDEIRKQNDLLGSIAKSLSSFGRESGGIWAYTGDGEKESQRRDEEEAERRRRFDELDRQLRPHAHSQPAESEPNQPSADETETHSPEEQEEPSSDPPLEQPELSGAEQE